MIMLKYGIEQDIWDRIIKVICAYKQIHQIILFGSRAKGNFRNGSDIDLAVKGDNPDFHLLLDIRITLDDLNLPWEIDIIDYDKAPVELKEHIDRVGIELSV